VSTEPLSREGTRIAQERLQQLYPGMTAVRMKSLLGKEAYEIKQGKQVTLVDAASGRQISPLGREDIVALADAAYVGEGSIRGVEWVTKAPSEVGARPVPLWAVHYDEPGKTTLYFSPFSGDLVARRHELWRWFDLLWMFHIMDYEERENVNNTLLRAASISGLAFALSGAWLLFYSFSRRKQA
jgi:hypothetical protein